MNSDKIKYRSLKLLKFKFLGKKIELLLLGIKEKMDRIKAQQNYVQVHLFKALKEGGKRPIYFYKVRVGLIVRKNISTASDSGTVTVIRFLIRETGKSGESCIILHSHGCIHLV